MRLNHYSQFMPHSTDYYEDALSKLKELILHEIGSSVSSIIAFGGAARNDGIIPGWSDLDILIISNNICYIDKNRFYNVIATIKNQSGIPLTLVLISELAAKQRMLRVSPSNSVILNALSGRPQTSRLLSGQIDFVTPNINVEKANALSYLDHMSVQIRRHLLEGKKKESAKEALGQVVRWTSSILRASLRYYEIFVLPYEETLDKAIKIYTDRDFNHVATSFNLRYSWHQVNDEEASQHLNRLSFFIENFLEDFFNTIYGWE
jgi:hypothetical protein